MVPQNSVSIIRRSNYLNIQLLSNPITMINHYLGGDVDWLGVGVREKDDRPQSPILHCTSPLARRQQGVKQLTEVGSGTAGSPPHTAGLDIVVEFSSRR